MRTPPTNPIAREWQYSPMWLMCHMLGIRLSSSSSLSPPPAAGGGRGIKLLRRRLRVRCRVEEEEERERALSLSSKSVKGWRPRAATSIKPTEDLRLPRRKEAINEALVKGGVEEK